MELLKILKRLKWLNLLREKRMALIVKARAEKVKVQEDREIKRMMSTKKKNSNKDYQKETLIN